MCCLNRAQISMIVIILTFQQLTECTPRRHRHLYMQLFFSVCLRSYKDQLYHTQEILRAHTLDRNSQGSSQQQVCRNMNSHTVILQSTWLRSLFVETTDPRRSNWSFTMTELRDADLLKDLRGLGKPPTFNKNNAAYQNCRIMFQIHISLVSSVSQTLRGQCEAARIPISLPPP